MIKTKFLKDPYVNFFSLYSWIVTIKGIVGGINIGLLFWKNLKSHLSYKALGLAYFCYHCPVPWFYLPCSDNLTCGTNANDLTLYKDWQGIHIVSSNLKTVRDKVTYKVKK